MRINEIVDFNKKCTGCLACKNICPKGAIELEKYGDGFYYPYINEKICINCGLCEKVCSINKEGNINNPVGIFVVRSQDEEVRLKSSSGGIFAILSREVMNSGGIVFGVAYCAENKNVQHLSTEKVSLEDIMRSKYVQSYKGNIYALVEKELKAEKEVLFSGTPCEIRALKAYLNEKKVSDKNLITVDFMCHGVPSPGLFEAFVSSLEKKYNSKVKNVTFREKENGWRTQIMKVYFEDGRVWKRKSLHYYYYYYFLNNYSLRNSCYGCKEYCSHESDITMADYWNISPDEDDNKGTSLIICNTKKGNIAVEKIKSLVKINTMDISNFNYDIYSHQQYNFQRKLKWAKCYKKHGINGVKTWFYLIEVCKNKAYSLLRMVGGKIKRIVKLGR